MSENKIKIVNSIDELIQVLDLKPGEKVELVTPQFEREYDLDIKFIPKDEVELNAVIRHTKRSELVKMGVRPWATWEDESYLNKGEVQYLFPGEWYDYLPNGFEVVGLSGEKYKFKHGESDDDIRFGCLPYGFIRKDEA